MILTRKGSVVACVCAVLLASAGLAHPADGEPPPGDLVDRRLALEPNPDGAAALARVLRGYHERGDGEGGFEWWMRLPFSVRATQVKVPEVTHWRYRVEFLRDAERSDAAACRFSGGVVLRGAVDNCDYATEVQRYFSCTGYRDLDDFQADVDPAPGPIRTRLENEARACAVLGSTASP